MSTGRVFIYGGRGALGDTCVSYFKNKKWWVGSIDLKENEKADANVLVEPEEGWLQQVHTWIFLNKLIKHIYFFYNRFTSLKESQVLKEVSSVLDGNKLDAVICVAGGWAGGNAASPDFVKNADMMWKQSVWSSTIAASVAAKHLKPGGFLSLPGAFPAKQGTPGMIGYGMAKAAVHQLTKSLAGEKSGLPENALVVATLPVTLDTPMNRKWMPKADTSTWTPLEFIAETFYNWSTGKNLPKNGSLVSLVTKDNQTTLTFE
ncbi:dihydropteridine reductase isoform X1 [Cimex lectularius]|uniref:Dihydropteridine reductase n=1 Tax=Cimex lectularius TaxID=79782 RepID=A0A8I6RCJ8_CIMLE|nr:dihydropteridine reductase isoform X1 [Cimex lectularius]